MGVGYKAQDARLGRFVALRCSTAPKQSIPKGSFIETSSLLTSLSLGRTVPRFLILAVPKSMLRQLLRYALRAPQILPRLAMRNTKHGSGLGAMALGCGTHLRMVESVSPPAPAYEKWPHMHLALLTLACILICWKFLQAQPRWLPG